MVPKKVCNLNPVMWLLIGLTISFVSCDSLLADSEFKTHYEKNKINKGVWLRHKHRPVEQKNTGHFFRSISNEHEPNVNFIHASSLREKRAAASKSGTRHLKNNHGLKEKNPKASLFNDNPMGVAMLLEQSNNNLDYNSYTKTGTKIATQVNSEAKKPQENHTNEDDSFNYLKDILNITEGNVTAKRSMTYDQLVIDRVDLIDMFNKSKDFDNTTNGDQMWQTAPVSDRNVYEIVPQEPTTETESPKPMTEKGLVKVLSMLTRTLKKIMKQHNAIKVIHDEMNNANKQFGEKIIMTTQKLNEFDVKYTTVMNLIEKLNNFHECLKNKEEMFKKKEEILTRNLLDFENQQNKFLEQQQQFYNIQKMMLLQNEKVNEKQNSIAKMQSEISHRQNHFAKVLKKAKQALQTNKYHKLNPSITGTKASTEKTRPKINYTTTTGPTTTIESIKINLLSAPLSNVIENHDQMILKEKDDKSVDDLIYKYYFNNTFIDTIIKNKILGGIHIGDKTSIARSAKLAAKRNQKKFAKNDTKLKTTLLFPVDKINFKRERRWINHHSTRKHKKRHHSKGHPVIKDIQNNVPVPPVFKPTIPPTSTTAPPIVKESNVMAKNPFLAMATNFCKEIGQNSTKQILDWCVEKAIRRLSNLDRNMMAPPALPMTTKKAKEIVKTSTTVAASARFTKGPVYVATTPPSLFIKNSKNSAAIAADLDVNQFFPDNQELEQNLKDFDLTPDTAGNVYFDGSLHASEILGDKQSEGLSDVLPGYDSNSKVDIDPRLIQMQLRRQHIKKKIPHNRRINHKN